MEILKQTPPVQHLVLRMDLIIGDLKTTTPFNWMDAPCIDSSMAQCLSAQTICWS